jgi:adenine/guanine/hypoxanthine permease
VPVLTVGPRGGDPVALTIGMMPFTFSITNDVGARFIAYTVIKVFQAKVAEVHLLMYLVSAGFVFHLLRSVLA